MAQITDDCFAFAGPLLPIAEMERLIAERITPVPEIEAIHVRDGLGRVVANDVVLRSICRHSTIPLSTDLQCRTPISQTMVPPSSSSLIV